MSDLTDIGLRVLNIPEELQDGMQWAVSTMKLIDPNTGKLDKAPRNPFNGKRLSVTDPEGWCTFEEVINSGYPAIGVRLTSEDPFVVIDLDKTKACEPSEAERQNAKAKKIYNAFDSYTEHSYSKGGVHIILKGDAREGRRRENVEVYSQERYIITTGLVLKNKPIIEGGELLGKLYDSLDEHENPDTVPIHDSIDEAESDQSIITKMFSAKNGQRVKHLYDNRPTKGDDWSKLDAQLCQHIAYYTQNHDQALRLFRGSKLYRGNGEKFGYKDKTKYEQKYLMRTFSRAWANEEHRRLEREKELASIDSIVKNSIEEHTKREERFQKLDYDSKLPSIERPEGLLGDIADYIYTTAPRPVWEVAVSGALAFMASVAGRHYNINGSGLGLYIIILAKTGRGKEAAATGISCLFDEIEKNIPSAHMFRGPSHIASGQALIRCMAESGEVGNIPSKLMVLGEFGHTLKIITDSDATAADMRTRQAMLDLFSKNGWGSVINGSAYADTAKNTESINSPNLVILGDTTPDLFFKSVSLDIINEGFLPRFLMIEYDGPRGPANYTINRIPPQDLVARVSTLITQVVTLRQQNDYINVLMDDEASTMLEEFDSFCDEQINTETGSEEMWNRAHLKALRVAGSYAVGCNIFQPVINAKAAQWAIELVKRDIKSIESRIGTGNFGGESSLQEAAIRERIAKYITLKPNQFASNRTRKEYHEKGYIPKGYFTHTCGRLSCFKDSRSGLDKSLDSKLRTMVAEGDLHEIPYAFFKEEAKIKGGRASMLYEIGPMFETNWKQQNMEK